LGGTIFQAIILAGKVACYSFAKPKMGDVQNYKKVLAAALNKCWLERRWANSYALKGEASEVESEQPTTAMGRKLIGTMRN
jgi:hypothetical protein